MALVPFPGPQAGRPKPSDDSDLWESLPEEEGEPSEGKMSFLEHLDELRRRLIISAIALGIGILISFTFVGRIFDFIFRPMQRMLPPGSKLIYTEPTEAFTLNLQIAFLAGCVLAAPVILYQFWLFIAPGLYAHEKRFAIPFVLLGTVGFVLGAAFSHYLLFPWMWVFLASFSNDYVMFAPKLDPVFDLYSKLMLGMGLVFQMPTIVFFLSKMGLISARFLISYFKYAVLIIFIVAAVITPTGDMLTQTLFAAPMIGLYIISIAIAALFGKKRTKTVEE